MFKKLLSFTLALAASCSLLGCTQTVDPLDNPAPVYTALPQTIAPDATVIPAKEGENLLALSVDTPMEIDINADGKNEIALLTITKGENLEDGDYESATLTITKEGGASIAANLASMFYDIWVYFVKLDPDSDAWTIVYSYEHSSADFDTKFLTYDGSALSMLNCVQMCYGVEETDTFLFGKFEGLTDSGTIKFTEVKDIIGTYVATREYSLQNGAVKAVADTNWILNENAQTLKTKAELPVTLTDNTKTMLSAGTEIRFTEISADESTIYFTTADEKLQGSIKVTASDIYYPHLIDGKEESHYFEEIPYAG